MPIGKQYQQYSSAGSTKENPSSPSGGNHRDSGSGRYDSFRQNSYSSRSAKEDSNPNPHARPHSGRGFSFDWSHDEDRSPGSRGQGAYSSNAASGSGGSGAVYLDKNGNDKMLWRLALTDFQVCADHSLVECRTDDFDFTSEYYVLVPMGTGGDRRRQDSSSSQFNKANSNNNQGYAFNSTTSTPTANNRGERGFSFSSNDSNESNESNDNEGSAEGEGGLLRAGHGLSHLQRSMQHHPYSSSSSSTAADVPMRSRVNVNRQNSESYLEGLGRTEEARAVNTTPFSAFAIAEEEKVTPVTGVTGVTCITGVSSASGAFEVGSPVPVAALTDVAGVASRTPTKSASADVAGVDSLGASPPMNPLLAQQQQSQGAATPSLLPLVHRGESNHNNPNNNDIYAQGSIAISNTNTKDNDSEKDKVESKTGTGTGSGGGNDVSGQGKDSFAASVKVSEEKPTSTRPSGESGNARTYDESPSRGTQQSQSQEDHIYDNENNTQTQHFPATPAEMRQVIEEAGLQRIPVVSRLVHIPGMLFSLRHTRSHKKAEAGDVNNGDSHYSSSRDTLPGIFSPQSMADSDEVGRFYGHHDVYLRPVVRKYRFCFMFMFYV